jgi:hypothetical protein
MDTMTSTQPGLERRPSPMPGSDVRERPGGIAGLAPTVVLGGAWVIIVAFCGCVVYRAATMRLPDELEAIHTAWKVLHGERIYVDFFQHHHPALYYVLAAVIAACGETAAAILACRLVSLFCLAGILGFTFAIGRRLSGTLTGTWAVLLLLPINFFSERGIDVRPDVPQTLFGMAAIWLALGMIRRRSVARGVLGGICLGIAFLFTQKAVFTIAAVGALVLWQTLRRRATLGELAAWAAGGCLVVLPFLAWIAAGRFLPEYLFLNWTLNAHFLDRFSSLAIGGAIYRDHMLVCALAVVGCCFRSAPEVGPLTFLVACLAAAPLAMRAPYPTYWMLALPLAAVLAAHGLVVLSARRLAVLLVLTVLAVFHPKLVRLLPPRSQPQLLRAPQVEKIEYVLSITRPNDCVYDAWNQFNVFRPDIDFFWFSVEPNRGLDTYRMLRPYAYDVYARIDAMKPKVIATRGIENLADPRIARHYVRSERYEDLMIRTP